MKLSHLALLNIRHNLKRYAMYLFAMVFCIFTVHTFLTLTYSESVLEAVSAGSNTYRTLFLVFALVVIAFTLFFLISSNNSFIRARKKELSTYALFGMTNGRIGRLMLMEVMMLGTVALVIGILLSLFFSKLVVMILLKLALANISGNVVFAIEPKAIVLTIGVYYFIFLLMGLTGLRVISRFQLVDLFKGDQIAEKRTGGSTALLIISIIMIVGGYLISFFGPASMVGALMLPIIGTVVVGTYLFFWSGLPKMLKVRKDKGKNKGNGERMVSTALLSHRTRTVSSMMATIAVLVAISASGISVGFTLFRNASEQTYGSLGFDLTYFAQAQTVSDEVNTVLEKNGVKITNLIEFQQYDVRPQVINAPETRKDYIESHPTIRACSVSDYNQIVSLTKNSHPALEVAQGEAYIIDEHFGYLYLGDEKRLWNESVLKLGDSEYDVSDFSKFGYHFGSIIVAVFNDQDFNKMLIEDMIVNSKAEGTAYIGLNYSGALKNDTVASEIADVLTDRTDYYQLSFDEYTTYLSVYGLICFIGFFVCVVFILMTASTMYFKQITAATEEKDQFEMLRKIGVDTDTEKRIIQKRILPLFLYPLGLGILHSIFAMKSADAMVFGNVISADASYLVVLKYSFVMYAVFALVYGVMFYITKNQYYLVTRKQS